MMKVVIIVARYTMTLFDFIKSELIKKGFNEFVNNDKLTFYDDEFQFMQKMLKFDKDVLAIVNEKVFKGFKLKDELSDLLFKKSFTIHFLDREINRQTVEAFGMQVITVCITHEDYLNVVYSSSEVEKYLQSQGFTEHNEDTTSNTDETSNQNATSLDNSTGMTANRNAYASLPQSEVNIDVDNTTLQFADNNTIDNGKTVNKSSNESNQNAKRNQNQKGNAKGTQFTKQYLIDNIDKAYDLRKKILNEFDKKCFLQIW